MIDDEQQDDIDTVPLRAVLQATASEEADALWDRAVEYERAIRNDPDFEGADQRDIYQEVGRRLESHLGDDGVASWLEEDANSRDDEGGLDLLELPDDELESKLAEAAEAGELDELFEQIIA